MPLEVLPAALACTYAYPSHSTVRPIKILFISELFLLEFGKHPIPTYAFFYDLVNYCRRMMSSRLESCTVTRRNKMSL